MGFFDQRLNSPRLTTDEAAQHIFGLKDVIEYDSESVGWVEAFNPDPEERVRECSLKAAVEDCFDSISTGSPRQLTPDVVVEYYLEWWYHLEWSDPDMVEERW